MALIGHTHFFLLFLFFTMALIGHTHFFIFFIFYYGTHRPYSFISFFLKFYFLFCVNEKIIKRNKKEIKI